ncbi:MAG: protocatechuate 3,4-dioxygenase subunit alpha [Gammaproteobacteria bacterium]
MGEPPVNRLTPSQTVGPYFHLGLDWPHAQRLVDEHTPGQRLLLTGHVLDGEGAAVPDALIEIWQADARGHYAPPGAPGFRGFGRAAVDGDGRYAFETIRPGAVADPLGPLAPHVNVAVFARGLLTHLYTRLYFADEATANAADPVLARVPAARRETLLAHHDGDAWVFDIRLQGLHETVFLDV